MFELILEEILKSNGKYRQPRGKVANLQKYNLSEVKTLLLPNEI
jgi:hypothetical protein